MKEIILENINFWGENWNSTLIIPDDMVFVEVYRHKTNDGKDPQRFYASFYPYDEKIYKELINIRTSVYNVLNTWIYIELSNVNPVNEDIPLISMEEFNNRYVRPKKITKEGNPVNDLDFFIDPEKIFGKDKSFWYTISMSKPLRFCGNSEHLQIEIADVDFTAWLDENTEIKAIMVAYRDFKTFLSDDYIIHGKYLFKDDEESWNKYKNRIKEILNYSSIEL